MRLATFSDSNGTRIGLVVEDQIVDLKRARPELPTDMIAFLAAGPQALEAARGAIGTTSATLNLKDVRLHAPVPKPSKFLAIGLNYADHVKESGLAKPSSPLFFNKQVSCVTGPFDPILMPYDSEQVDYEGEMGFIIGKRCRRVSRERAHEVIAGYCVINDVSIRDWQFRAQTFTLGKSFDGHGPVGPWIVTPDELKDPHQLRIRTWVNGELRQDSSTDQLIYDCFEQVAALSQAFTLEPGDIVSTGTPAGVGMGFKPPKYLKVGDVVKIELEGVGVIENRVAPEPA
ncbi:MAG TPA: fumarylacetoacetate hydrolase family protein [Candidatus Binataceae bacterium]|nr:fumarylacetoacetate hydrolase family protein [Candidatus Binataceae bacterium]